MDVPSLSTLAADYLLNETCCIQDLRGLPDHLASALFWVRQQGIRHCFLSCPHLHKNSIFLVTFVLRALYVFIVGKCAGVCPERWCWWHVTRAMEQLDTHMHR